MGPRSPPGKCRGLGGLVWVTCTVHVQEERVAHFALPTNNNEPQWGVGTGGGGGNNKLSRPSEREQALQGACFLGKTYMYI